MVFSSLSIQISRAAVWFLPPCCSVQVTVLSFARCCASCVVLSEQIKMMMMMMMINEVLLFILLTPLSKFRRRLTHSGIQPASSIQYILKLKLKLKDRLFH